MDESWIVDFPTLADVQDPWVRAHCCVPDGFDQGEPFVMADWQFWCTANHYRVRSSARWQPRKPMRAQAFTYRRSLIVGPQKSGKGPWSATVVATEAVGPALFAGWAEPGDGYACSDWGCGCGFEYEYEPGDPMGMPNPTPLIQLTATSEDQVDNVYRPLRSMIKMGPLADLMLIREGFIEQKTDSDDRRRRCLSLTGKGRELEDAVLNANYVLRSCEDLLHAPYAASGPCMHEALFGDEGFADGFTTLDLAKALIDEGYHPMTMYFPLVVHGAMLVEPTETESKAALDQFIGALRSVAERARAGDPALKQAPIHAPRRRLDETLAARKPVLAWSEGE